MSALKIGSEEVFVKKEDYWLFLQNPLVWHCVVCVPPTVQWAQIQMK